MKRGLTPPRRGLGRGRQAAGGHNPSLTAVLLALAAAMATMATMAQAKSPVTCPVPVSNCTVATLYAASGMTEGAYILSLMGDTLYTGFRCKSKGRFQLG
jgi:hypothetical protein